jgi:hypothetical protein
MGITVTVRPLQRWKSFSATFEKVLLSSLRPLSHPRFYPSSNATRGSVLADIRDVLVTCCPHGRPRGGIHVDAAGPGAAPTRPRGFSSPKADAAAGPGVRGDATRQRQGGGRVRGEGDGEELAAKITLAACSRDEDRSETTRPRHGTVMLKWDAMLATRSDTHDP